MYILKTKYSETLGNKKMSLLCFIRLAARLRWRRGVSLACTITHVTDCPSHVSEQLH